MWGNIFDYPLSCDLKHSHLHVYFVILSPSRDLLRSYRMMLCNYTSCCPLYKYEIRYVLQFEGAEFIASLNRMYRNLPMLISPCFLPHFYWSTLQTPLKHRIAGAYQRRLYTKGRGGGWGEWVNDFGALKRSSRSALSPCQLAPEAEVFFSLGASACTWMAPLS